MDTLTWVDEVMPVVTGPIGDPQITFDLDLPEPMLSVVQKIADEPDTWTCQAEGCTQLIGWVLREPDDPGDRGGLGWRWVSLVQVGAVVLAVCEECTPSNLYPVQSLNGGQR